MIKKLLAILAAFGIFALALGYAKSNSPIASVSTEAATETTQAPETTQEPETTREPETTQEPSTAPTETAEVPSTETPTEAAVDSYVLTFAGDCTFADNYNGEENAWGTFTKVVGTDYDFPFALVRELFENDDLTLVNLEFALTTYDPTEEEIAQLKLDEKTYRFRGDPAYVQILTGSSVEFVSAANNHSTDFGWPGHKQTQTVLEEAGISYATWGKNCLLTTESGLTVGIYAASFHISGRELQNNIQHLRQQGAELVICSFHWGEERTYAPTEEQQTIAYQAIDAGADIVYGHHPHVLQPMESYNGGLILYSMGNFSFGGNRNPEDKDTAVIQQEILRYADGSVSLGQTVIVPCSVSSSVTGNNFQPMPYAEGSEEYLRVLSKLDGTYAQVWLEEQATAATEETETTEATGSTAEATEETVITEETAVTEMTEAPETDN